MDRTRLCKEHLALAERHVAMARCNVDHQRGVVAALTKDGHRTDTAAALLALYERLLGLHLQDRRRLKGQLAALRQPASRRLSSGWSRDTQR